MSHAEDTSPCIGKMNIDECTGFCTGCFRRENEIRNWEAFSDNTRESILSILGVRRKANE